MPDAGAFFIGVGTGENLNERVLGAKWPAPDERLDMLEEAVGLMRELWQGDYHAHRGTHYTVENLRIFDVPDQPPDIARRGHATEGGRGRRPGQDALVNVAPKEGIIQAFEDAGGNGKPKCGQVTVCWAESKDEAKRTAFEVWPNALVDS